MNKEKATKEIKDFLNNLDYVKNEITYLYIALDPHWRDILESNVRELLRDIFFWKRYHEGVILEDEI